MAAQVWKVHTDDQRVNYAGCGEADSKLYRSCGQVMPQVSQGPGFNQRRLAAYFYDLARLSPPRQPNKHGLAIDGRLAQCISGFA
jgi:hypothetical protein